MSIHKYLSIYLSILCMYKSMDKYDHSKGYLCISHRKVDDEKSVYTNNIYFQIGLYLSVCKHMYKITQLVNYFDIDKMRTTD